MGKVKKGNLTCDKITIQHETKTFNKINTFSRLLLTFKPLIALYKYALCGLDCQTKIPKRHENLRFVTG